jgi:hypothetical protein
MKKEKNMATIPWRNQLIVYIYIMLSNSSWYAGWNIMKQHQWDCCWLNCYAFHYVTSTRLFLTWNLKKFRDHKWMSVFSMRFQVDNNPNDVMYNLSLNSENGSWIQG